LAEFITSAFSQWVSCESILLQRWFIILMVQLIVFPFTILRKIDALKVSSLFAVACVIFT
jgi:amino acid permease